MLYKSRSIPPELLILHSLNKRINLTGKYLQNYFILKKGYEGEVMFDLLTEKHECDCLILNDLRLIANNSLFQIDTLIIFPDKLYIFEIKNFEGDYYLESDRFYAKNKLEYPNPLIQLTRCESHFRQLLQSLKLYFHIDASVVFINPEFTLYQMPLDKPIISPNQVKRFLNRLDTNSAKLQEKHRLLADKLVSLHITKPSFDKIPPYEYKDVRKGITCIECGNFSLSVKGKFCVCSKCGKKEVVENAILRVINEFKLLFPNEKITTNIIYDWCQIIKTKKTIRKTLGKNYNIVGIHQWSHYE